MLRGLYTAAFGMINSQNKQDVSANNIANSTTIGYKQDKVVSKSFPEVMLQNMDNTQFGKPALQELGSMPLGVYTDGIYTDFNEGVYEDTDSDLDMAIQGKGLFAVTHFDGSTQDTRYTRDGSFKLDSNGMLVTSNGDYVLGTDVSTGQIGPMQLGEGKVTVDSQGRVYVDSKEKYTIQVVDFNDYNSIEKLGNNMYGLKDNNTTPVTLNPDMYVIGQKKLEMSNVDMNGEMVDMITNLRNYQANQRVLQSIDETLDKAVNEVGAVK